MKKENKAIIEMLVCAALWSTAGIFIKLLPWNGFAVAGLRSLIAGLTMAAYMRIKKYRYALNRRTLVSGIFTACVYTCFVVSNKLTTAANAIVLQFTSPVFLVVFSALFLKQRIRRADIAVVVMTLLGIALFFLDQLKPGYLLGNLVAIGAGMFMAGMFMTVGEMEGEERFSAIVTGQFITFLAGLPFIVITRPAFTPGAALSILALGVFQLGISYILYVKASRYCPPLACCLLGAVEPLLNPVWVFLFDGERPGFFALIGSVVVVASVTVWCVFGKEKAAEPVRET
ncbi:MAG: EamA family transporter [Firmicutes bacterium]|nr:EamA family transporter [Bacillota bacterium]